MMTDEERPASRSGYDAYAYMAKDADRFDAAQTPPGGVSRSAPDRTGRLGRLGPRRAAAVIGVVACALAIGGTAVAATRGTPQSNVGQGGFGGRGGFGGPNGGQFGGGRFGQQNGTTNQFGGGQPGQNPNQGQRPTAPQAKTTNALPALPPNKTSGDASTDSSKPVTTSLTT